MTLVEINPHSMMSYEWTGVLGQGPPALLLACLGLNLAMIQIREQTQFLVQGLTVASVASRRDGETGNGHRGELYYSLP